MAEHAPDLSLVIPLYNEAENLEALYREVKAVLDRIGCSYEILFVDDGSSDGSFAGIQRLAQRDPAVRGIALSRNFGHQVALAAGLDHAAGASVATMDADLQHPPALLAELWTKYREGFDIVTTIRREDRATGALKRATSSAFYRVINALSDTPIDAGGADFRLMSRKAVDAFKQITEHARFTRGLVNWMGFSHAAVPYTPLPRHAGRSKYSLRKMCRLALDGLTAFSATPLRLSFYAGLMISAGALIYAIYAVVTFWRGAAVPGWTSILVSVLFLGGIQLVSVGILGEYQARIFTEVKRRPLYFIDRDTRRVG